MSHDNTRFNVSGDSIEGLAATLTLWGTLHGHGRKGFESINFSGYTLHPQYGMVLHIYDTEDVRKVSFPFSEGKNPSQLATFFYNYLHSDKSTVDDKFEYPYMSEDTKKQLQFDMDWDRNGDHDGDNERGWRVFTNTWGHVLSSSSPLTIRPIYCWYGK